MGNLSPKYIHISYKRQFEALNYVELRDQWPALKRFKIKRIFQRFAICTPKNKQSYIVQPSNKNIRSRNQSEQKENKYLNLELFCQMFPEFIRYEARIFQIFDHDNDGKVYWQDFYTMISVCYFADQKFMAQLMFMIFDLSLDKKLDRTELTLLLDLNAIYIREKPSNENYNKQQKNKEAQETLKLNESILKNQKKGKQRQQCSIVVNPKSVHGTSKMFTSFKTINRGPNTSKSIYQFQQQITYYQPQQIIEHMLANSETITLQQWLQQSKTYIDFVQFRRFFNIFKQQKLQKQLITHFYEWNDLYDIQLGKYVSYLISFKWFQCWKIYVQTYYGVHLNLQQKNPVTIKSLKTKKSLKTNNSGRSQTKMNFKTEQTGLCKIQFKQHSQNTIQEIKNYDLVNRNIGQKPETMYNSLLQYQYQEVLKPGLIQNRDYVFVSEKVWNHLKQIYDGFPQFRRTGYDQIQIYPKNVKIYSCLFKGEIDTSSEVIRQVSNYTTVEQLMIGSLDITKQKIKHYSIYYRFPGMPTWQKITETSIMFTDLTTHILIFLIYLQQSSQSQQIFQQKYLKQSTNINQANLGDIVYYCPPQSKPKKTTLSNQYTKSQQEKSIQVLYINRNIEGKYILHIIGKHYDENLCLTPRQFGKFCKLKSRSFKTLVSIGNHLTNNVKSQVSIGSKKLKKTNSINKNQNFQQYPQTNLKRNKSLIYSDDTNVSFLISIFMHFNENTDLRNKLIPLSYKQHHKQQFATLNLILGYVFHLLIKNTKVEQRILFSIIDAYFPWFSTYDISLFSVFLEQFMEKISNQFDEIQMNQSKKIEQQNTLFQTNIIKRDYHLQVIKTITCPQCKQSTNQIANQSSYMLKIPIAQKQQKFYEIIFVPFCNQLLMTDPKPLKKYGFQLSNSATLRDYKNKFQEIANLKQKPYILLEITQNTIIKNFTNAQPETLLEILHIREDDTIYAFQLQIDFQFFIKQHYSYPVTSYLSNIAQSRNLPHYSSPNRHQSQKNSIKSELSEEPVKLGQLVDCKNKQKGWIVGKVLEKDIMPYTYKQNIKVIHKHSKSQHYEVSYEVQRGVVSHFPLNSFRNCDIYHIQVHQRFFNEQSNQMKNCQIPIILPLPNWMRYRQFQYILYVQMQKFISPSYRFYIDDYDYKYAQKAPKNLYNYQMKTKQSNKAKLKKFKQYLNGKQIPYKFSFSDKSGRCLICYKVVKNVIYKGQKDKYCQGCKLPKQDQPICWQIRVTQLQIALDWKISSAVRPLQQFTKIDQTIKDISDKKKAACEDIEDYIYRYLAPPQSEINQLLCCNKSLSMKYVRKLTIFPKFLIISLQRVVQQNGFKKTIRQPIGLSQNLLKLQDERNNNIYYQLVGVTTYKGLKNNLGFCTYIKQRKQKRQQEEYDAESIYDINSRKQSNNERWCLYNGDKVFTTYSTTIDKTSTLIYIYKKLQKTQNTDKENQISYMTKFPQEQQNYNRNLQQHQQSQMSINDQYQIEQQQQQSQRISDNNNQESQQSYDPEMEIDGVSEISDQSDISI